MKLKYFIVFFVWVTGTYLYAQTSYSTHRVQKGETVFGIAQQYQIEADEILKLNPEIAQGLRENSVIIIPVPLERSQQDQVTFKEHKVKRKETLYGIASQYGVGVEDIKKYNKHLYAQELKKGEKIKIPVNSTVIISNTSGEKTSDETDKHLVKPKETKYGIARQYGITVAELEALNPVIYGTDALPVGLLLNIPVAQEIQQSEEKQLVEEAGYEYYTVKPREGFYRIKVLYGLSQEEVIAHNPQAKEGLKAGMVLKIPKKTEGTDLSISEVLESSGTVYLENRLTNLGTKNVVLLLPLQLQQIEKDSVTTTENLLQNSASLRIAVEFYKGALIAADFAKQQGISINFYVFDYQEVKGGIDSFLDKKNISKVDLVIGPLHQSEVEKVSADLAKKNIPVLSPLSNRRGKNAPNFLHSIPSNEVLEELMLSYLKNNSSGKNLVLICDNKKNAQKRLLTEALPGLQIIDVGAENYIKNTDVAAKLSKTLPNWVILETDRAILVSSVVNTLHHLNTEHDIRMLTLDKNDAFEFREVSNMHLAGLQFTFPAVQKPNLEYSHPFFAAYRELYKNYPNRFAVRGFDVTYDALLRLAVEENIYETNKLVHGQAVYAENKFNYIQNTGGGYQNIAAYILQYTPELDIIEAP